MAGRLVGVEIALAQKSRDALHEHTQIAHISLGIGPLIVIEIPVATDVCGGFVGTHKLEPDAGAHGLGEIGPHLLAHGHTARTGLLGIRTPIEKQGIVGQSPVGSGIAVYGKEHVGSPGISFGCYLGKRTVVFLCIGGIGHIGVGTVLYTRLAHLVASG